MAIGDIDLSRKPQKLELFLAKPNKTIIAKLNEAYSKSQTIKLGNINELSFTIPYEVEIGHELVENPNIDILRDRYLVKAVLNGQEEWYMIANIEESSDDSSEAKNITAYSLPYEMGGKNIRGIKIDSANIETVMNGGTVTDEGVSYTFPGLLKTTKWTLGYVDADVATTFRSYDFSQGTILDCIFKVAETTQSLIVWDTVNRKINFYNPLLYGTDRGLSINYGRYLKSLKLQSKSDEMTTVLNVWGKDDISINSVNITGQSYLEDYSFFLYPFQRDASRNVIQSSYYMSDDLCHAILDYKAFIETKKTEFSGYLTSLDGYKETLKTKNAEKLQIEANLEIAKNNIDLAASQGQDTSVYVGQKSTYESQLATKNSEIATVQDQIDTVNAQIVTLTNSLQYGNFFTPTLLDELKDYQVQYDYVDTNVDIPAELLKAAQKQFELVKQPQVTLSIDIVNFLNVVDAQRDWDRLLLGDIITVRYEHMGVNVTAKIIEYTIDHEQDSITISIANVKDILTDEQKLIKLLYNSTAASATIDMSKSKWDGIDTTKSQVAQIINNTWDANKIAISAGVNNSVTINGRGIMITNPDDPNNYLVAQNGILAITNDRGNTWKNAITKDGIVAERLFGKLIAGVNLVIDASDTTGTKIFTVDGNGVTISGTKLTITNGLPKSQLAPSFLQEITDMQTSLESEISDLNTALEDTQTYVDSTFKDSVVDDAEKLSIKEHLKQLANEKQDVDTRYNTLYINTYLYDDSDTAKSGLFSAKADYDTKYTSLVNAINTAIADSAIIANERVNVDNAFAAYKTSIGSLSGAFETALDNISKHKAYEAETNAKDELSNFVSNVYASDISSLQSQIDGSITTWFYDYEPTLSNAPANTWTTIDDKNAHLGDVFYDTVTGYAYRFNLNAGTGVYSWVKITDVDVTKALADAAKAQDTADQKRRIFVATPTAPYDVGDLWQTTGEVDLKICVVPKAEGGSFSLSDWAYATSAKTYADTMKSELAGDISDVDTRVTSLNTYVDSSFKDSVITQSEAKAIEKYINSLNTEKLDIDNRYTKVYNNSYLKTNAKKTALSTAKTDFDSKHTALISSINTAIADGTTSTTEKADVDAKFAAYKTSLGTLTNAFQDAIDDISKNQAAEAETNAKNASVGLGAAYNGVVIDATNGLVITKSDNTIRTLLNATVGFKFQKTDGAGGWVDKLSYDANTGNLVVDGSINARELKINGTNVLVGNQISGQYIDKIKASQIDVTTAKISAAQIDTITTNQITVGTVAFGDSFISSASTWHSKETPSGAQTKANTAESNAKGYADNKDTTLRSNLNMTSPLPTQVTISNLGIKAVDANNASRYAILNGNGLQIYNGAFIIKDNNGVTVMDGGGIYSTSITGGQLKSNSTINITTDAIVGNSITVGESVILSSNSFTGGIRWGTSAGSPQIYIDPISTIMTIYNNNRDIKVTCASFKVNGVVVDGYAKFA